MVEEKVWNIVSAYAPQIGFEVSQKEEFCREMDGVIQRISEAEEIRIGGDVNSHVGCDRTGFNRVHGGYRFGLGNDKGGKVLDFSTECNLAILNTNFRNREEHYVTLKVEGISLK
ncbi:PREDICTED: uncharacterized protein LOC107164673 [Diuraphis noxia]|uniref:uncharacterized protein LOC107164673 n=1 Tax=Diuraphis noxia TaxID=143948 RepID=UPI000763A241|nr:PREDICTED: uncharacterized protein LOC107164673 [Diuraphis noxia]